MKPVECGLTVAINSTQILKPTQGHKKGTYSDIDPDNVQVNCRWMCIVDTRLNVNWGKIELGIGIYLNFYYKH